MTRICLIRHGETEWNRNGLVQGATDIPLNDCGRDQARIVGEHLAGEQWDAVYSSPLSRARETAAIIAAQTGVDCDIITDRRLQERCFGEAEGIEIRLRKELFSGKAIPGAETWEEVQARALEMIDYIALAHRDQRVLAVAHGGLISALLLLLCGDSYIPGNPPLRNSCMNMLKYDGSWRVEWFNRVAPELELLRAGV